MNRDRYNEREQKLADILSAERADSFGAHFPDRVMSRITRELGAAQEQGSIYDALSWVFARVAVACLVLIVALSVINTMQFGADGASWVDAMFGLPSTSIDDLLTYAMM